MSSRRCSLGAYPSSTPDQVLAWRAGLRRPLPFEVQGSGSGNYLLAMAAEPEELTRPHIAALLQEAWPKA